MNWELIGVISELIGSVAVVLTLFYLIAESKKNTRALNQNSSREFGLAFGGWHLDVAGKPEALSVLIKSAEPVMQEFSAYEWSQFRLLAVSNFYILQSSFLHGAADIGNQEESRNMIAWAKSLITSFPAWQRFWDEESQAGTFTLEFRNAVNSLTDYHDARFTAENKS